MLPLSATHHIENGWWLITTFYQMWRKLQACIHTIKQRTHCMYLPYKTAKKFSTKHCNGNSDSRGFKDSMDSCNVASSVHSASNHHCQTDHQDNTNTAKLIMYWTAKTEINYRTANSHFFYNVDDSRTCLFAVDKKKITGCYRQALPKLHTFDTILPKHFKI